MSVNGSKYQSYRMKQIYNMLLGEEWLALSMLWQWLQWLKSYYRSMTTSGRHLRFGRVVIVWVFTLVNILLMYNGGVVIMISSIKGKAYG